MLQAIRLTTEYLRKPIEIDIYEPRFSWNLRGDSLLQRVYQIRAAAKYDKKI